MRRRPALILLVALAAFFVAPSAQAVPYASAAEMTDAEFLQPHHSDITGEMVHNVWRWYGIPPHILLSIMGAETSLGDPVLGGRLISEGHHNYGCMRYNSRDVLSSWGSLARGTVVVAGKSWLSFPSMEAGMTALALYLKAGPSSNPGCYLRCFRDNRGWPAAFASVYYGRNVPGFWQYVANLKALDAKFCRVAVVNGWLW